MELETIILSELIQIQKTKIIHFSLFWMLALNLESSDIYFVWNNTEIRALVRAKEGRLSREGR